jgi:hypothetical protein
MRKRKCWKNFKGASFCKDSFGFFKYHVKENFKHSRTGVFPHNKFSKDSEEVSAPRPLVHDPLKFILLHVFFLTSSIVFYAIFKTAWTAF